MEELDFKGLIKSLEEDLAKPLKLLEKTGEIAKEIRPVIVKIQNNEQYTLEEVEKAQEKLLEILKIYDTIGENNFSEMMYLKKLKSEHP